MTTFSADGRRVLSASWDKTAQVHDAVTGELLFTVRHDGEVYAAVYNRAGAFSPDPQAGSWPCGMRRLSLRRSHRGS